MNTDSATLLTLKMAIPQAFASLPQLSDMLVVHLLDEERDLPWGPTCYYKLHCGNLGC